MSDSGYSYGVLFFWLITSDVNYDIAGGDYKLFQVIPYPAVLIGALLVDLCTANNTVAIAISKR